MSRRAAFGFNLLAPYYDICTTLFFAGRLSRAQKVLIPKLRVPQRVLIFGGGSGKILVDLLRHAGAAEFYYVDISRQMLVRAERRLAAESSGKWLPQVTFICGSVADIPPIEFDLVVTPFVLDCFAPAALHTVMRKLYSLLAPGGQWLFTDFHVPAGFMRAPAASLTRLLYVGFNLLCGLGVHSLPDFAEEFTLLGLKMRAEEYSLKGMLVSRLYER